MKNARVNFMLVLFLIHAGCRPEVSENFDTKKSDLDTIVNSSVQMPDSITQYLQAALDTMKKHSIRTEQIHWENLKKQTYNLASGAVTYSQTYYALSEALKALGDNHSFFKTPVQNAKWSNPESADSSKHVFPAGRFTDEGYAVIPIRTYSSGNALNGIAYAIELQKTIMKLDNQNPVAWIIDMRYNRGGNMWPVLAGLGPLLESEKPLGSFISSDNKIVSWKYLNGIALLGESVQVKVPYPYKLKNKNLPIAIFTSQHTSSSAEAIVISFVGRPKIRIFGTPTAGLSTANSDYTLKDGAQLILTTAILADRNIKRYGGKIIPHEDLSDKWYYLKWFQFVTLKSLVSVWISAKSK